MNLTFVMTRTFLRLFSRDRQAIFFSLFFPLVFMTVFGLAGSGAGDPMKIGVVDNADNTLSRQFVATLSANPLFEVSEGDEAALREQVIAGDLRLALILSFVVPGLLAFTLMRMSIGGSGFNIVE